MKVEECIQDEPLQVRVGLNEDNPQVVFLRYVVPREGIQVDESKIKAIKS